MNDTVARLSAITSVVLAIAAGAFVYVNSKPGLSGTRVQAEFQDAYPLLEGMHVREYGAVAGTVSEIEVTDRGTALVTLQLNEGTDPPRADAIATIRQEDITGDSYVSLSPGDDDEELGDVTIPISRTMVAPRFDDLLNSFNEPVRQGLQLTLVQLGRTLESRGEDLNRAALQLRPAFEAIDTALTEVDSQTDALKQLVADAEQVTSQAASRSRELGDLVEGLSATAQTTAAHSPGLDAGLDNLPQTLSAARGTLARLTGLTEAAHPLALSLRRTAPELARTARLLGPFTGDAEAILDDVQPVLGLTARSLAVAGPVVAANPKRVFTAPFDVSSGISKLLDSLIGNPELIKGIFGADTYGGTEPGNAKDDVGFGAFTNELGTQQGYPDDYDPLRKFARASLVPSCETFGVPVRPGCLADALALTRRRSAGGGGGSASASAPANAPSPGGSATPAPAGGGGRGLADGLGRLGDTLDQIAGGLGLNGDPGDGSSDQPGGGAVGDLLDFLLRP